MHTTAIRVGWNDSAAQFHSELKLQGSGVFSPATLLFSSLLHNLSGLSYSTGNIKAATVGLERTLGYGLSPSAAGTRSVSMDTLDQYSRDIAAARGWAGTHFRRVEISLAVITTLEDVETWRGRLGKCSPSLRQLLEDHSHDLCMAAQCLRPQCEALASGIKVLDARLSNLSTVVFHLMSHEDANASASIAAASKDLAEATRRDSSSMKTIAIMTMVFLPGTFFAALFAVPSLQWDQPTVVSDRFWVYWALTIPSTVAVLLIWAYWEDRSSTRKQIGVLNEILRRRKER
ncbi:hypothetical protein DL765_003571 [Monosporascus sp. GIB2]|nr:hypothetical protein DL765_003571 [Monosporascus sp. GIB2]